MGMYLKKEENIFEIEIKNAQKQGKKVYILGAALGARRIAGGLKYRGLEFDAFIVDSEYYEAETTFLGKNVYCIDEVIGGELYYYLFYSKLSENESIKR